ncbi:GNAT family N-acetyltransferase [Bacillus sp. V2I10]|uniref:GNAT family N-acetyltransferase n=1 Tax=Bacillus sp. V2I10 TaxID=3042276 RepID=UPI002789F7DF|nr:GNAT family N-acetyltransferase [Bacillus sp. V2I10]MDQ0859265.1 putative acetyltransferase [Bacillus sp. V2I10]
MEFSLKIADFSERTIVENLLQYYSYDFTEFNHNRVNDQGRFNDYPYFENYWTEIGRYPYLIKVREEYAGFVMVRYDASGNYFSMAEFFIMKKFRQSGLGKKIAHNVFQLHSGKWEVLQVEKNKPAQSFWRKVIGEFTAGDYTERMVNGRVIQTFCSKEQEGAL